MLIPIVLLSALGFAGPGAPGGPDPAADPVRAVLDAHHFEEGCAPLLALPDRDGLRERLLAATAGVSPPWAALRAAGCLTELAATDDVALAAVSTLIQDPERPGFVLSIVARLDLLPEDRALGLATRALERSADQPALRASVPARLRLSAHPAVRAAAQATSPAQVIE